MHGFAPWRYHRAMNRAPALPLALIAALLAAAPATVLGKAYKCTIDGKTVYQDRPCAGPAPAASVAAPAVVSLPPRVSRSAAQIFDEIQMVQRHERELANAYEAEAALARPRLAAMDAKRRQLETQQMEARWLPRIRVQRQNAERLQAELRVQCPGGASMRAGRLECSR